MYCVSKNRTWTKVTLLPVILSKLSFNSSAISFCSPELSSTFECSSTNFLSWETPWISTSMAISYRSATTFYSRSSERLLSISNLSEANPQEVAPSDLFFIYNGSFGAPNTPTSDNSILWLQIIFTSFRNSNDPIDGPQNYFRQMLTYPLVWFQNNAKPDNLSTPNPDLPSNLYTTMAFAKSVDRSIISQSTVIAFTVLACVLYLLCVLPLLCVYWFGQIPQVTPFLLLDFVLMYSAEGPTATSVQHLSEVGGDKQFKDKFERMHLFK